MQEKNRETAVIQEITKRDSRREDAVVQEMKQRDSCHAEKKTEIKLSHAGNETERQLSYRKEIREVSVLQKNESERQLSFKK
jgi:hypothetical protein